MKEDNSGPAFPRNGNDYYSGMTLRQWYAGQALVGIVTGCWHPTSGGAAYVDIAKDALEIADAMIEQLKKE